MMKIKSYDQYGKQLNSYDVLKLIALVTMVIDHLGFYLFPEQEWMRAVGRMSFPLFLYLVGYSAVWKVTSDLIVWAAAIIFMAGLTYHPILPLNILVTIAVTRYLMNYVTARIVLVPRRLVGFYFGSLVLLPLCLWFDYYSIAFLFAMSGYLQKQLPGSALARWFLFASMATHLIIENYVFPFQTPGWICMIILLAFDTWLLNGFQLRPLERDYCPAFLRTALLWCARNTLPLYALHVMLIMVLKLYYYPERLQYFHWM